MKHKKRESGFVGAIVIVMAIGGALTALGLLIPAWRPLAFEVGTAVSLAFLALGIGVALYAAWRIVTFPYRRRRKASILARAGQGAEGGLKSGI